MASPGNQHCANCIGTLSFPIVECRIYIFYACFVGFFRPVSCGHISEDD